MNFKHNGIILSKRDIGEADRLYTIYTLENGKIRAKAVGVKKPNAKLAGNLEPITQVEIFMARGRGRGKITGVIALNNFLSIKSDFSAMQKVFYVFGIMNRLISEEEKDEKIFELLVEYLKTLDGLNGFGSGEKLDIITSGFLFKFMEALGYRIEAEKCVRCRSKLRPEDNYFSAESGGVVCPGCVGKSGKKIRINPNSIKLIRLFLKNKIGNLEKIEVGKDVINNLKIIQQLEFQHQ